MDPSENLPETALDLGRRHATPLDRSIEITAGAELHDFAPMHALILYEVHRFDDIDVMKRRRNAKLRRELLDVFFFCLIFPSFSELLHQQTGTRQR